MAFVPLGVIFAGPLDHSFREALVFFVPPVYVASRVWQHNRRFLILSNIIILTNKIFDGQADRVEL